MANYIDSIFRSIGSFFSVHEKTKSDERRYYSSLKYSNIRDKRIYRTKNFNSLLSSFNRSADRRHQRKLVKIKADQDRRTIAMQRGYW